MIKNTLLILLLITFTSSGANLGNPTVSIPGARVAVGASYHLGGYTITNLEILSMFNRFHARIEYAPLSIFSFGIDLGATQIEVDKYMYGGDTFPVFHGKYDFSGGGHLKLSTPFFLNKTLAFTSIGHASLFSSKNSDGAMYEGYDGAGAIGIQAHIPRFGFITAGPMIYLIKGKNKSYTNVENVYSNVNNIRGWLAIDFFPDMKEMSSNKTFLSIEITISPSADYSKQIPIQECSISICLGSVSKRLYGVESGIDWKP